MGAVFSFIVSGFGLSLREVKVAAIKLCLEPHQGTEPSTVSPSPIHVEVLEA